MRRMSVSVLVLGAVLVGCGGGDDGGGGASGDDTSLPSCPIDALPDDPAQPVEIVLWHSYQVRQETTLREIVDEYNAGQDRVHVTAEFQGVQTEHLQKFQRAIPHNDLPAITAQGDWTTQFMIDSGVALPVQACLDADRDAAEQFDDLVPVVRAAFTVEDVLWPGAFGLSTSMLGINRDHFRSAGLDPDKPPGNMAELRAAAEQIKAAGVSQQPMVMKADPWRLEFWVTGAGEALVDNDNGHSARATASEVDNPATHEALTWLSEMVSDGLLKPESAAEGNIDDMLSIATQSSSMVLTESAGITTIAAVVEGSTDPADLALPGGDQIPAGLDLSIDFGTGAFPGIEEPGRGQIGGSAWYLTNTGPPEEQAAAWDFMRYFNSVENQVRWLIDGSNLVAWESVNDEPEVETFFETGLAGTSMAIVSQALADLDPEFTGPVIGPYDKVRLALTTALEDTMLGGADPDAAVTKADAEIDRLIKAYDDANF